MQIDPSAIPSRDLYQLTISLIVPRPIGWTSTISTDGVRNLAPFSFFNAVGGSPAILMLSINQRAGQPKDTLANILATREFVINLVNEPLAEKMNLTSGNLPPEVDEFQVAGLTPCPSVKVKAPRIGEAFVSMECALVETTKIPGTEYTVVFGQVVWFHIADNILDEHGRVDPVKLQPVARLGGGGWYTTLGKLFEMKRPP